MRGSRTTAAARHENPSMWQRPGRLAPSQSSPSLDYRFSTSVVSCSSREASQTPRNLNRSLWPVITSAGGSTELSPTRARRLTASGSSLSWQRSLRPPPASPGDRVCRREARSASCPSTAVAEPRVDRVPSGRCCRLLRDRGNKQGRYLVVDRCCFSFRHAVAGVAVERRYCPGRGWSQEPAQASGMLDQHARVPGAASRLL